MPWYARLLPGEGNGKDLKLNLKYILELQTAETVWCVPSQSQLAPYGF